MIQQPLSSDSIASQSILYTDDFAKVYYIEKEKVMVCEASSDYIPIEDFKHVFHTVTDLFDKYEVEKFVFDKQKLRIFHQPSMEWYFVVWKKEMFLKHGLKVHRKVLPQDLPGFENAVKAGRKQIELKYSDLIIDQLEIDYRNTIEEAISS